MTPAAARERPQLAAEPGRAGADVLGAISGPPGAYAEASLEAEAWRLGPGAR